jgi:hypothetical protein
MRPLSLNAVTDSCATVQPSSAGLLFALLAAAAWAAGCGGGIAGSVVPKPPVPTPTPSSISITVTPATASVLLGNPQTFASVVTGATDTRVLWSVNNVPGGNLSAGFITAAGVYTAPQILPIPTTITITAQSAADSTKQTSATIVILSDISVVLTPNAIGVELGAVQPFHAAITSAGQPNAAIRWSLSGVACPTACGSLDVNGNFTAPQFLPAASAVTLTAQSVADPAKQASTAVIITSNFSLQLSAPPAVASGGSGIIASTLTPIVGSNPSTNLSWTISGPGCSGTSCGVLTIVTS